MTRSERTLWRRWVERRDGEAFAALVKRHARFVYDFARRVAGNAADAEDLTQEAYLKLAEADAEVPDEVGLRAFLGRRVVLGARILKRAALARRRHEGRAPHPGGVGGPEELERREQAQKALDLLPAGERRAVELRFLHDLSYAEIAAVLGTTEEAARMRVHRGLERVKARCGASACLAALALFEPPARMLASTAKTALLTGGVVVAQATGKKAAILVGLALVLGLLGTVGVHMASKDRDVQTAPRAPLAVAEATTTAQDPDAAARADPPPAPPSFNGLVIDTDGKPIARAIVRALHYSGHYEWLEKGTGEDGRFTFDVVEQKKCTVEARHPSYATTVLENADTGSEIRLVLEPGVTVRVEVRGGGRPIGGARVLATDRDATYLAEPLYRAPGEAVTSEQGVAEFHVPAGRFTIWAGADGWAPKLAPPVICVIGQPQEVRVELEAGGFVEGTIRDSRGAGIAGARVVVQAHPGFRGTTTTGSDGSYVLEHVPLVSGPTLLVVTDHPDHAATSEWRMWSPADGERMRFDLVFPETAGLHGVVLDASGQPLPSRRLVVSYNKGGFHILYDHAWMSDRYPFAGTTDEAGRFELTGIPPGKATIYLFPNMDRFETELAAGRTTGPVELRLAGIALRGRVLDADGNPVAGAQVGDVRTDSEGQFASKLRPKEIVVQAEGHVPSAHAVNGDFVEVRLSALAVKGTVVDPGVHGIPNITVTLHTTVGDGYYHTETRTDEQGRFRFRGAAKGLNLAASLPTGNFYELGVRAPGRDLVGGSRSVWGPQEGLVFVLAAPEEAERLLVRGTVVDEDGKPIDEAPTYGRLRTAEDMNPPENSAAQRAGKPSSFVCERLEPRGEMKLVFNARGYLNSEPIAVVFDGRTPVEPITVRLRRGTEVEVCVREEDGTPVPGAFVLGYAKNRVDGRTDAQGQCVLSGLPPGRNRITVSHPHLTEVNEASVEATAGARQRVELRGKAAGKIIVRIPAEPRAKGSLLLRLIDSRGVVARETRVDKAQLAAFALAYQRQYDFTVIASGTYRVRCEIDGVALPEAEVEARLRETAEVDLKPAR